MSALAALLNDKPGWNEAVEALGRINGPQAIAVLGQALNCSSEPLREAAVETLGQMKSPEIAELLGTALRDNQFRVREKAARALGQINHPRALELLGAALKDSDDDVRQAAIETLAKMGDRRAVGPLVPMLQDSRSKCRGAAAQALQALGWVPLNDEQRAAYAIAKRQWDAAVGFGSAAVEPLLRVKLREWSADQEPVDGALRRIESALALQRDDPEKGDAAVKLLECIAAAREVKRVLYSLNKELYRLEPSHGRADPVTTALALTALEGYFAQKKREGSPLTLKDIDRVRAMAHGFSACDRSDREFEFEVQSRELSNRAAQELARLGPSAIPALAVFLESRGQSVRARALDRAAAQALEEIGGSEAELALYKQDLQRPGGVPASPPTDAGADAPSYRVRCLQPAFQETPETRTFRSDPAFAMVLDPLNSRRYEEAARQAKDLLSRYPDFDLVYKWLGMACRQLGEETTARDFIQQGLEKCVRKCLLLTDLGELEWRAGRASEALRFWSQALHCQQSQPRPIDYNAYLLLGYAAQGLDLTVVAEKFLTRVDELRAGQIRLEPSAAQSLVNLFRSQSTAEMTEVLQALAEKYLP